jgi:minor histocompatibility antigen H13
LAFKYLDGEWINYLFHFYFTLIGVFVITTFFYNRLKEVMVVLSSKNILTIPKIPFLSEAATPIDSLYLILFALSSIIGASYYLTKHYYLNNVYGVFFSIVGIESVMVGATNIGFILLVLLFFYDIYWVFFTPVMVTVAKSLQGPIKLMFPKAFEIEDQTKDFNMIGLGDIVIPGIYVALILRYDYLRVLSKLKDKGEKLVTDSKGNFIIPFTFNNFSTFIFTFFGYFLGILSTLVVMNVFQHAQPALLYLVPGVLIGSSLPPLFRRKFIQFFMFEETTELVKLGLREEEKKEDDKKQESTPSKVSDKPEANNTQVNNRSQTPKKKLM